MGEPESDSDAAYPGCGGCHRLLPSVPGTIHEPRFRNAPPPVAKLAAVKSWIATRPFRIAALVRAGACGVGVALLIGCATPSARLGADWQPRDRAGAPFSSLESALAAYRAIRPPERHPTPPPDPAPKHPIPEFAPAGLLVFVYSDIVPLLGLLRAALAAVPVLILARSEDEGREAVEELNDFGFGSQLAQFRLAVRVVEVESVWVRDYGSLFAEDAAGRVIALDSLYAVEASNPDLRPGDDVAGTTLARSLGVPTWRPPLVLAGGNFAADGVGGCFTSTETIRANGGSRRWVDRLLRDYLGCERVVYLEPLPGPITKHIDMFFRLVRPGVVLLAEYEAGALPHSPEGIVQTRARAAMERNREVLSASDGVLEITRVPMPPITRIESETALSDEAPAAIESRDLVEADDAPEDFAKLVWDLRYRYRSYLNYVQLATDATEVLLVPSYEDALGPEGPEERALAALRRAFPRARIASIDSDELILKKGALHCATWVVPRAVELSDFLAGDSP